MAKYSPISKKQDTQDVQDSNNLKIFDLGSTDKDNISQTPEELARGIERREEAGQNPSTIEENQAQSSKLQQKGEGGREHEQIEKNNDKAGSSSKNILGNNREQSQKSQQEGADGGENELVGKDDDEVESPSKNTSENDREHSTNKSLGTPPPDVESSKWETPTINEKVQNFVKLAKEFSQATLVTISSNTGQLKSRPMYVYSRVQDLQFYLLSKYDSNLVSDIREDSRVNINFQQTDKSSANWCSISAKATIVTDHHLIESLWTPNVRSWLKDLDHKRNDGSKNDPRIVSILIEPRAIDFFFDCQSAFERLKYAIVNQKPSKYDSDTTCHLTNDEIATYIKVHCHPQ